MVNIKVVSTDEPTMVSGGIKTRYCCCRSARKCKVSSVAGQNGILQKERSYTLKNFLVREFRGKKYISMPKEGYDLMTYRIQKVIQKLVQK